ncbi:MAG: protein translocase subunit SecF [Gemmatimonadota bacterium]|nr:protein translocase subunit SecF [Gemmatimonadota bacterium]
MWLFHKSKYEFIALRRKAYVVSAVVLALGVAGVALNLVRTGTWQNYGVDFTGGVLVQVRFDAETSDSELRQALGGVDAPPITRFGGEDEFVVRAPVGEGSDLDEVAAGVAARIAAAYGDAAFEIVRRESVGKKIGDELESQAVMAVLLSFLLTLLYIAVRFEVRFGVAAIIATAHDVLVTLGMLALFRVEISLPTVAAILTILGYSLNDTIVVFDRIRENLNSRGGRREDPYRLVNRSINETLPRTVLTSGTTLAVLLSLLVLGGAVIRPFTMVLILGVLIGTYSSIFIASPALLEIQKRYGTADPREKERKRAARRAAAV